MKKSRFSEEQIIGFLKQAEAGVPIKELCRKGGFSDATFYKWRSEQHHLSERRACRLEGLTRDAYRHPPVASSPNRELSGQIIELAHVRRRFGYRRLHDLLRPAYPQITTSASIASTSRPSSRCASGARPSAQQ